MHPQSEEHKWWAQFSLFSKFQIQKKWTTLELLEIKSKNTRIYKNIRNETTPYYVWLFSVNKLSKNNISCCILDFQEPRKAHQPLTSFTFKSKSWKDVACNTKTYGEVLEIEWYLFNQFCLGEWNFSWHFEIINLVMLVVYDCKLQKYSIYISGFEDEIIVV